MNCRQLQDQSGRDRSSGRPAVAGTHGFCALLLTGLAILAGAAGASMAASGSNGPSDGAAPAIRDPMNPEAYMRDLAGRMNPADKDLLLHGVGESKTSPATTPKKAPTPPRKTNPPAPSPASQPTTPPAPATVVPQGGVPQAQSITPGTGSTSPSLSTGMGNASPTRDSALKTMSPDATDRIASPAPLPGQTSVGSAAPTPQVVLSQPLESPAPAPAVSTVPALSPALVEQKPSAANAAPAVSSKAPLTRMEPGMAPIHAAQNSNATAAMARGSGSVEKELQVARTGLTLWNEPELARAAAKEEAQQLQPPTQGQVQAAAPEPQVPWTLGGDLEKYRAHAVKDGSRNSGENLKKALERAGMAVGDGVNVFLLGYASDRAKPFRENDGKSIFDEPGKVPARAGATIASFGYALYSIADVVTLNALPDPNRPAYKDNNVLVRPFIFTGRTVVGVWKTTEEVGNALTWGLFDNVTGCVGLVIEDVVEFLKHAGEAVTNVVRAPFHLAAGKKPHEGTDQAMDWILLVPLELASNAVEMKGFSNMQDYKTAFADKGVIGSVLEFGGSTYIVYQAVDKVVDKCKKNNKSNQTQSQSQSQSQTGQPSGSNTTGTGTTGTSTGTTGTSTAGTDTGGIVTTSDTGGTYTETITYPSATNTTPVGGGDAYFFFDPTDGTIITGQ